MTEKKFVALTFDDGPTPGITDQVLDVLKENDIVASFFLIGQKITEQSEYLIRRAYDMGCSIENHSKTHPGMPELNDREILDEVSYTTEQIVRITGEKPEFFRPPYISYNQKMYDALARFPGEIEAAVTNIHTGKAEYMEVPRGKEMKDLLIATCSLPILFQPVKIGRHYYLDGGLADSVPYEHAMEMGC